MTLRARLKALEVRANPRKPWFCIDIDGKPTDQQQQQMNDAHADGREVYAFQSQGDTLGIWLVDAKEIYWSDE
jgi:uncharacterized protein YegL